MRVRSGVVSHTSFTRNVGSGTETLSVVDRTILETTVSYKRAIGCTARKQHTLMVKVARSKEGLVDRWFLRGVARCSTIDAFPLTWMPERTALAKLEVGLMAEALKRLGIIFAVLVVVVVGWFV